MKKKKTPGTPFFLFPYHRIDKNLPGRTDGRTRGLEPLLHPRGDRAQVVVDLAGRLAQDQADDGLAGHVYVLEPFGKTDAARVSMRLFTLLYLVVLVWTRGKIFFLEGGGGSVVPHSTPLFLALPPRMWILLSASTTRVRDAFSIANFVLPVEHARTPKGQFPCLLIHA